MQEKKAFIRKHVFINRQLQGRYMLTFMVPMLVMLVFLLVTLFMATGSILSTSTRIIKNEIENKSALAFADQDLSGCSICRGLLDDISAYLRNFSDDKKYRAAVMSSLLWVCGCGLLILIIQIAYLTIFFSHKLAGPIYRLEKACHSVIAGNYTEKIVLRKHDEMQNLALLFNEMIQCTSDRMRQMRDEPDEEQRKKIGEAVQL